MSWKQAIIDEFATIIRDLETLLTEMEQNIPSYDRYSREDNSIYDVPEMSTHQFDVLRVLYLQLLSKIPSSDNQLLQSIEHGKTATARISKTKSLLRSIKSLKGNFEAGLLDAVHSTGDKYSITQNLLQQSLYDVEHLQPPYPVAEIDKIEKTIKSHVRFFFGEDSSQYREIDEIYNPQYSVGYIGAAPDIQLERHIQKWDKIVNLSLIL